MINPYWQRLEGSKRLRDLALVHLTGGSWCSCHPCGQVSEVFWPHVLTWETAVRKWEGDAKNFMIFEPEKKTNTYGAFLCLFHMDAHGASPKPWVYNALILDLVVFSEISILIGDHFASLSVQFPPVPHRPTGTQRFAQAQWLAGCCKVATSGSIQCLKPPKNGGRQKMKTAPGG